jgi:hypothetical protein
LDSKTAARIEALRHAPGWEDLSVLLGEIDEKYWRRLVVAMQTGQPVDQREIDFARGIQHGIRHLLKAPENAAKVYERLTQEEKPVED